ncbi:tautomerase family protein [Actinomycetospora sp. TBRC 11914]|uniref:tautomerase family protein n=1 Tax=Actinomycetospora sp. TBRC 11914 TaxID=2729387 RepID=UPI00145E5646|nr:tautomerase family protein [Actinomycetospora sp. TBRC 11914]NMO91036.1 4-oxalocrotonate tautomerase [Actinomycetospora sp. TBRC 11914]
MPVVEIHLVEGQQPPARIEELLRRVSERYAAVLESPITRIRAFVTMHPPELWSTGGVTAAVDGDPAPYFVAAVLEGRPAEQRQRLLAEITDTLCEVLGATRSRVRGRIAQVPPEDWGIGGVPASSRRREEIVARSSRL